MDGSCGCFLPTENTHLPLSIEMTDGPWKLSAKTTKLHDDADKPNIAAANQIGRRGREMVKKEKDGGWQHNVEHCCAAKNHFIVSH